ncbi:MAG: hypothetical protein WC054_00530 [Candidatus Nanopelagicales bacterium]
MAQGMCPGCGETGSVKAIDAHVGGCSKYAGRWAAGEELLSPAEEFRRVAAERVVSAAPRPVSKVAPEVSVPAATVAVAEKPKRTPRRAAPVEVPVREPGPVNVEFWDIPQSL